MNIKVFVIGVILGVVLHFAIVALGLLISYLIDWFYSKARKTREKK